jgi:hypothetical protein
MCQGAGFFDLGWLVLVSYVSAEALPKQRSMPPPFNIIGHKGEHPIEANSKLSQRVSARAIYGSSYEDDLITWSHPMALINI